MITPNDPNDQDDFLDTDQNDRQQDINNSDAAKFTEDAEEDALIEATVKYTDSGDQYNQVANAGQPLTTQGNAEELEANMGGTTNLSLDQLKKAHHPEE